MFSFAILPFTEGFLVSAVVNVQYNIDREQKKPVSTIFIRNLEMKSPAVFCLAEVSLFCFDRSVVTLHRRASVTPPFPPLDFLLSISASLVVFLV